MTIRHFAYFSQAAGRCIREWSGPVPDLDIDQRLVGDARLVAMNDWQQRVAPAEPGEVGLDVTHIGWPVGDFRYCWFDSTTRLLDWGPDRYYIEVSLDTLEIVANVASHRPVRDAVPGQRVIDITGSPIAQFHGHIFGRFVRRNDRWTLEPDAEIVPADTQRLLTEAPIDALDIFATLQPEYAPVKEQTSQWRTPPASRSPSLN